MSEVEMFTSHPWKPDETCEVEAAKAPVLLRRWTASLAQPAVASGFPQRKGWVVVFSPDRYGGEGWGRTVRPPGFCLWNWDFCEATMEKPDHTPDVSELQSLVAINTWFDATLVRSKYKKPKASGLQPWAVGQGSLETWKMITHSEKIWEDHGTSMDIQLVTML